MQTRLACETGDREGEEGGKRDQAGHAGRGSDICGAPDDALVSDRACLGTEWSSRFDTLYAYVCMYLGRYVCVRACACNVWHESDVPSAASCAAQMHRTGLGEGSEALVDLHRTRRALHMVNDDDATWPSMVRVRQRSEWPRFS